MPVDVVQHGAWLPVWHLGSNSDALEKERKKKMDHRDFLGALGDIGLYPIGARAFGTNRQQNQRTAEATLGPRPKKSKNLCVRSGSAVFGNAS